MTLKNKFQYSIDLGLDAFGNITRINNCLDGISKRIPLEREKLDDILLQFENAKIEIQKEFPQENELKEKTERLNKLNIELNINEKTNEILDGDEIDSENISRNNRDLDR